jgi:hypothetical protein
VERSCGLTNRNRIRGCHDRTSGLPTTKSIAIKGMAVYPAGARRRQLNLPQEVCVAASNSGLSRSQGSLNAA